MFSCLPAESARRAALPVLFLLTGWFLGFTPRRGDTLHRSRCSSVPNFTLIGSGVWVYGKKLKKFGILPLYLTLKGGSPARFLPNIQVLCASSVYISAKFDCFISINDKIINNLPRSGRFQPNFRWPLVAKLLLGPKKVWGEMMAWTTSIIMQNLLKSNDAFRRERTKCDVFHFVCFFFK